jgi:hypothetical protein
LLQAVNLCNEKITANSNAYESTGVFRLGDGRRCHNHDFELAAAFFRQIYPQAWWICPKVVKAA